MKDGDAQQHDEVLRALKEVFPNAIERECGWNIGKLIIFFLNWFVVISKY